MTEEQKKKMISLGLALAGVYMVYRFAPQAMAKTAAVSVGAVIIAKQIPFVGPALA